MQICTTVRPTDDPAEACREAAALEEAGLDFAWVPELYGHDAPTQMAYLAALTSRINIGSAVMPLYTRTPSLLAMTAASLDALSGGRIHLGIGASGPQVIEGFHGVPFHAPLGRTREIMEICHKVWARREPVTHNGRHYTLPLPVDQGTGLGKPLKLVNRPLRERIPIWVAAIGHQNVQLAAELAYGWLPFFFLPGRTMQAVGRDIDLGLERRDPSLGPLHIAAGGFLAIGEGPEVTKVRESVRPTIALYAGGMGARGRNFYNALLRLYGFEAEARTIQDLYLAGRKEEAAAAVPDELLDSMAICGSASYVAERIEELREAGVTHLNVHPVPIGGQTAPEMISQVKTIVG